MTKTSPLARLAAGVALATACWVGVVTPAVASSGGPAGGIEADASTIAFDNLAPGEVRAGYVALTNTTAREVYVAAITTKTRDLRGVHVEYLACEVPWANGDCAGAVEDVADYDLSSSPTQAYTLDYVFRPGHTTYFKIITSFGAIDADLHERQEGRVTFTWHAQFDPPRDGRAISVMPSTLTQELPTPSQPQPTPTPQEVPVPEGPRREDIDEQQDTTEDHTPVDLAPTVDEPGLFDRVKDSLASTGISPTAMTMACAVVVLIIGGLWLVRVRSSRVEDQQ